MTCSFDVPDVQTQERIDVVFFECLVDAWRSKLVEVSKLTDIGSLTMHACVALRAPPVKVANLML